MRATLLQKEDRKIGGKGWEGRGEGFA